MKFSMKFLFVSNYLKTDNEFLKSQIFESPAWAMIQQQFLLYHNDKRSNFNGKILTKILNCMLLHLKDWEFLCF